MNIRLLICSLLNHSNIEDVTWGYHNCARCGERRGDSFIGGYRNAQNVVVGHDCDVCKENYKKLSWKDKLLTPYPFKEKLK